jgi:hypothetical protein
MTAEAWPTRRRTSWIVAAALLALLGSGGFALGLVAAATGGRIGLLVVGSPFLVVAAVLVYLSRARRQGTAGLSVSEVAGLEQRGIVLAYSAALGWGYLGAGAYSLLLFGLIAAGGLMAGGLSDGPGSVVLLVVALLVCAYLLWCAVDVARGRLRVGYVALTPEGIHHRSWATSSYLPWTDVVGVLHADATSMEPVLRVLAVANTTGHVRQTSWAWRQQVLAFAPNIAVQGRFLVADPELLYRAVRFYYENPAARAELGGEAGLARVRSLYDGPMR